ncbi:MAG TPA: RsmG family class I SAM-dependent methyltransferase [Gemmatimonadales bacterium]|nr:RsmG family class I SAM-dependent methyltransferase [Gemmatimonadales bacterium]
MTDALLDVLGEAQARGLLGPGPVEDQIRHSRALAELIGPAPESFLELGSGGGIPGLVLALGWRDIRSTLLDSHRRACTFLEEAVDRLGLQDRVTVACGRAEELAREPALRGAFELVVARSFGLPAVTAECAVGFLRPGGRLVVSEPPEPQEGRWDATGLSRLGLSVPAVRQAEGVTVAVLELLDTVSERWPRRPGIPTKRPLW